MKKFLLLAVILCVMHYQAVSVQATVNITVTENGSNASSTIDLNQDANTTITQNNALDVVNTVDQAANTGNNSASDNNGNVTIETGDVGVEVVVENKGNNSTVTGTCCTSDSGTTATITGNATDSTNTVSIDNKTKIQGSSSNTAKITNNISGYVNTGNNKATDNNGTTTITTGDITIDEKILNKTNTSKITYTVIADGKIVAKISGNGEGSNSSVTVNNNTAESYIINNTAHVLNNSSWIANTGKNNASDNVGDVVIKTGDIFISSLISFESNNSTVDSFCCNENPEIPVTEDPDDHQGAPLPTTHIGGGGGSTTGGGGSNGGSSNNESSVLGLATGGIELPATGSFWTMWLTILAGILFFIGLYLRLNPGRAPNYQLLSLYLAMYK